MTPPVHLVIPDTQIGPGVPDIHLEWIGRYIVDHCAGQNLTIIHLGDHWDMPSLSSYDKGKRAMEGRRYLEDIEAGNQAFRKLNGPLGAYNKGGRNWWPRRVFLLGNHEDRITRAAENDPQLAGLVTLDSLDTAGWEVVPYQKPITIHGVTFCHYFYNPMTGRPYSGSNVELRLKTLGHSFTMGHQQTLLYGLRFVNGRSQHGLVAGSCYLHDEDYKGPQGNAHWRGIIVCHQVEDGSYDPMFISLDYLCRRYEGVRLSRYLSKLKWRK